MKPFTIQMVYSEIANLDPKLQIGSDAFKASVVMLSALSVGQNVAALGKFTGISRATIGKFAANLRKNGVWKNGKTCGDWFKEGEGVVAFWLDVNIALGHMARSRVA